MSDHEPLIQALHAPACYPHRIPGVDVGETHISSVLLTGEWVYEIKKPMRLGFLDFSTLAQRRAAASGVMSVIVVGCGWRT